MVKGFEIKRFTSSRISFVWLLKFSLYNSEAVRKHIFTLLSNFLISLYKSYPFILGILISSITKEQQLGLKLESASIGSVNASTIYPSSSRPVLRTEVLWARCRLVIVSSSQHYCYGSLLLFTPIVIISLLLLVNNTFVININYEFNSSFIRFTNSSMSIGF